MRSLVFQSYKPGPKPAWIARCMQSVKGWAAARGVEYREIGDELFTFVPRWFMDKCTVSKLPATDLGRLQWIQQFLAEGYERVIWVDSDVIVFKPEEFDVPPGNGFAFVLETTVSGGAVNTGVNNSVCMFTRGQPFLPFYIDACLKIGFHDPAPLGFACVGTVFLSQISKTFPFPVLQRVAITDGAMLKEILEGGGPRLDRYRATFPKPPTAANLCHSFTVQDEAAPTWVPEAAMEHAVDILVRRAGL